MRLFRFLNFYEEAEYCDRGKEYAPRCGYGTGVAPQAAYRKEQQADQRESDCEPGQPAGAQISTPSFSATVKMSLSPRPHKFARMMASLSISFARLATAAMACEGSSAGMIPSVRHSSWNASSASSSVTAVYSTRPMSFSHACSGPMPG